jgi:outer membrane autotransporter protein
MKPALLPSLCALCAFAVSSAPAQEIIFGTGSTNPTTGALVAGGTVRLTGDAASLQLDNGQTLTVSDYVSISGAFTALGGKNLTFRPYDDQPGQWAQLDMTGVARIFSSSLPATGTQTLHLDRVILSSGSGAGAALNATGGNANNALIIEGDVVFLNNININSSGASAAVSANTASLVFTGTTIFQGNSAGRSANSSDHGGALLYYPNSYSGTLTFQNDVLFLSNTMNGAQGGALTVRLSTNSPMTTAKFMRNTTFINNTAQTTGGGASFYDVAAPVEFAGDVTVTGNQAKTGHSGGMSAVAGTIVFSGTANPGATTVLFSSNTAATNAGGLSAVVVDFTGGLLKFTDNTAVTGNAGGINSTGTLRITGSYDFSNNQSGSAGGAVYSNASGANIILNNTGSFAGNIAGATGGAIQLHGINTLLDIRDGALFTGNIAGGDGGAIYARLAGAKISLSASTADIVFTGNKAGATLGGAAGSFTASGGTASAIHFASTGTLGLHAETGHNIIFNDPILGATYTVTVNKTGDGALVFDTHASDAIFNTTIGAGVLRLTGGAIYGRSGTGVFILNSGTLEGSGVIRAKDVTLAAGAALTVADGGALVIEAAGTVNPGTGLKLAGAGTLSFADAPQLHAGEITVGALTGSAAQTLAFTNTLALDDGAIFYYDLYNGNQSDRVETAGVTLAGTGTIKLGAVATGSFTLLTWAGAGLAAGDLTSLAVRDAAGGVLNARNAATLLIGAGGTSLDMKNATSSLDMEWTGATGVWTWQSSPSASANWTDNAATNPELYFRNGDSAHFAAATTGSVTVAGAGVVVSGLAAAGEIGTLTIAGGAIVADATSAEPGSPLTGTTGKLIKTGAGALVLANTGNMFKNGIELGGGVLAFDNVDQLATGAGAGIVFIGDATLRAGTDVSGLSTNIVIGDGKTATFDTQNYNITHSGTFALAPAAASGTFIKTGAGALTLLGDSAAYAGATHVGAGSLLLPDGAQLGGVVTVADGAVFGGEGITAGGVSLLDGSALQVGGTLAFSGTLTIANAELVFAGTNARLDAGSVAASGSNTIDLQGFNPGTYTLGNIGALMTASTTVAVTIDGSPLVAGSRSSANAFEDAGALKVNYSAGASLRVTWTGTGASNTVWDAANNNWSSTSDTRFAAGDTVVFTGSGADLAINLAGATVTVSDLEVGGSAALRLTGAGIVADKDSVREPSVSEITSAQGQLRKSGAGLLTLDNAANQFNGGIVMSGGTLAFSRADQIDTIGAAISFDADAALVSAGAGAVALSNNINIDAGALATMDVGAAGLTLSGTLAGTGTLAKTGAGALVYSGSAALGHAATQINSGLVKLEAIAGDAAPAIVHTFDIQGGWLDLSAAAPFDETGATASDWAQLTFVGSSGRVIAGNDKITLRDGGIGFGIGDETDDNKQGIFVEVNAGAGGLAVMAGTNYYAGSTRIVSGTLRVSDDAQLGLADLNREIIFAGAGALEIASTAFSSSRAIDLRADGVIGVAGAGDVATWSGIISGGHSLTKTGDGTLILAGANDYTGDTIVSGGTLSAGTGNIKGKITNNASFVFNQSTAGVWSGTVAGAGRVFKAGAGALTLEGRIEAGEFNINAGTVTINGGNPIVTAAAFNIGAGGVLRGTGTVGGAGAHFINGGNLQIGKTAGTGTHGAITINGDYIGDNGGISLAVTWQKDAGIVAADQLIISGSASGRTIISLSVTSTGGMPAGNNMMIDARGGSSEAAFELDRRYVSGYYDMVLRNDGGAWSLIGNEITPELPLVMGVDASALFIGKASMESLGKRFTATRSLNIPHRFELWLNGLYREDNISDTAYEGTESRTAGVQAGGDWSLAPGGAGRLTLGLFYDYARTDMTLPFADSSTETESHGAGGYAAYKIGQWYVNGLFRLGREDYTVSVFRTPDFEMEGDSWAASLEAGHIFEVDTRWKVEPQIQLSWQGHSIDGATDNFGRTFVIDSVKSFDGRVGVRLWEEYQWKPGLLITPYARLGAAYEFKGRGRVTVAGTPFENDLSGLNGLFDAGLAMQLGRGLSLHLDGSWYLGRKLDGYSLNLGAAFAW